MTLFSNLIEQLYFSVINLNGNVVQVANSSTTPVTTTQNTAVSANNNSNQNIVMVSAKHIMFTFIVSILICLFL